MKAIVYGGPGDVRVDEVRDPELEESTDAIVRVTASAICGFDLRIARGEVPEMLPGTILGHEGVGVIEDLGEDIRNFQIGDRVLLCPTLACGACHQCGRGHYAHCQRANPNGAAFGPAMFGGPAASGPFHGLLAEYARVPLAHTTMLHLPEEIRDADGLLLTDAIPTGLFGVRLTRLSPGQSLAVFGCGPVGQQAITCAQRVGAGRIFAIDGMESRLDAARERGAEAIDVQTEDPVEVLRELTQGAGVDCVIDAVPIDALPSRYGDPLTASPMGGTAKSPLDTRLLDVLERLRPADEAPFDETAQAFAWSTDAATTSGTVAVLCFHPGQVRHFPLMAALRKNLTLRLGTCHHRKYLPRLIEKFQRGTWWERSPRAQVQASLRDPCDGEACFEQRLFEMSPWD